MLGVLCYGWSGIKHSTGQTVWTFFPRMPRIIFKPQNTNHLYNVYIVLFGRVSSRVATIILWCFHYFSACGRDTYNTYTNFKLNLSENIKNQTVAVVYPDKTSARRPTVLSSRMSETDETILFVLFFVCKFKHLICYFPDRLTYF